MSYTIDRRWIAAASLLLTLGSSLRAAEAVVITDSGSTNTAGFRIEVSDSGEAAYTPQPRREGQNSMVSNQAATRQMPAALLKRFLSDLDNAKPLPALPSKGCMKSASFGTTLTVEYGGEKSPDLRCGDHGNAKLKALIEDTSDIIEMFRTGR